VTARRDLKLEDRGLLTAVDRYEGNPGSWLSREFASREWPPATDLPNGYLKCPLMADAPA